MSLENKIMEAMKIAMKNKDQSTLAALRAVKSELILAKTSGNTSIETSKVEENKLLQKLVKQRKDSAAIFSEQNREDLAQPELDQAAVISTFLPEQMTEAAVEKVVVEVITQTGASSMKDMGKVMGIVNGKLGGKADGKTISGIVKRILSN
ncbi:GatB/YqeY domain-containing protein [Flavobacteriaceae bacterium]|nr:GatB/YqeY domain-containing protein [Flavobacteriaceae bacterium]MDB4591373.1 GatB/YqeY domain-containing protein [Flavobacteriaceae bacterium]